MCVGGGNVQKTFSSTPPVSADLPTHLYFMAYNMGMPIFSGFSIFLFVGKNFGGKNCKSPFATHLNW